MTAIVGASLWAAFEADGCVGETRMVRTLRTLAAFVDRHPELDTASVDVDGHSGLVSFTLNHTELDLMTRVEAVGVLSAALDVEILTHTYDDGQAIATVYAYVSDDRRVAVSARVARPWAELGEMAVAS